MNQSTQPFKDKWIVVTRPEHQAKQLCDSLKQAGAEVILFPLIEISPPQDLPLAKQKLSKLTECDLLIFISPNAVDECLKWLDKESLQGMTIASVGAKTTAQLLMHGIEASISPKKNYNSEALLALAEIQNLGETASGKPHKVVILRGEGGRDFLKESLENQGCEVEYIELYRRTCPQDSLERLKSRALSHQLDMILITSGTSIEHLFALQAQNKGNDWLNSAPLLVGSERIKQQVLRCTSHHGALLSTVNPSDENLYQKLLEWSKTA
jgi:uroporphyrinogen-III synthase